ncbi:MAG: 2,3-bisphosphoglycerate-independent phosphoglycerate mutase [Lachnospiraceae bacterium]|nr:2,3-bisphosphoglycerate-independent phosphoglycerate mutase [Lachnospiraceae bacterium]
MATVLLVLDGLGLSDKAVHNAIAEAKTPVLDRLMSEYPMARVLGAGMAVGLPGGMSGNAAAGFTNMGAGRIVYQELVRIDKAIESGEFYENTVLNDTMTYVKANDSSLHLIGMISNGGAHSHMNHLYALLELARRNDIKRVYVHCITDGRDTPAHEGISCVEQVRNKMRDLGVGEIASVSGRYYAMDRDNHNDRVKLAYIAMTQGEGNKAANASEAVTEAYERGESDEFIKPTVVVNGGVPVGAINDDDAVVFFNFRSDRARELTRAFCDEEFRMFKRDRRLNIRFVNLTDPDPTIGNRFVAFDTPVINNSLGEYISTCGLRQLRLTESEVYPTVTYFFNCGVREPYDNEERLVIRSLKDVDTYASHPYMNMEALTQKLITEIEDGKYDFILCNLANADVIGHTGSMKAAKKAMRGIDKCLEAIVETVIDTESTLLICSSHGNVEEMYDDEADAPVTCNTMNPVPCILVDPLRPIRLKPVGSMADIAPTLLELMGLPIPKEMTGKSLLL